MFLNVIVNDGPQIKVAPISIAEMRAIQRNVSAINANIPAEGDTQVARVVTEGDTQVARVIAEGDRAEAEARREEADRKNARDKVAIRI